MAWVASAQPYPPLAVATTADGASAAHGAHAPQITGRPVSERPLAGFSMLDLSNVVAGPNGARMFAELGVSVVQSVPPDPNHSVTIVVAWNGEPGGGKRSIIINTRTPEGMKVLRDLAAQQRLRSQQCDGRADGAAAA
jgi:hypothetical protein